MAKLLIHNEMMTDEAAQQLLTICPFSALEYNGGVVTVNAACKMCRLCVKNGPAGLVEYVEDLPEQAPLDKDEWRGVAVFAEQYGGKVAPVVFELLGKARELAVVTGHKVYAVMIGAGLDDAAQQLLCYGADKVFIYDYPELERFRVGPYAACFEDFISKLRPSAILVGATNLGRSLAPRVAARVGTGLTADCTRLEMKKNTDLVQIRPAFGGNIMAQIVTPKHRPQFCTVRYKVFSAPRAGTGAGEVVPMKIPRERLADPSVVLAEMRPPAAFDISEAEAIVAVGRGVKSEKDLEMASRLSDALGAQMACTRPLIENGWFGPKKQIGLSGRTVKPKIIVTLGISGSIQFVSGMQGAERIIAINNDEDAPIFNVAHHALVGDLCAVVPMLLERIEMDAAKEVC